MGRLTLNVLLSFAQFEREVTSERIRDKIAASKRKGLWVGGPLPRGPPLFEPSFKVPRDNAHNQSSGFAAAPGFKGLNACGPLKVHPRRPGVGFWQRLEE